MKNSLAVLDENTIWSKSASHMGGNSGKGGDFLYRWGNPSNYGGSGSQIIPAAVHDPRWITDDGRPNGGYIQFFNNEGLNGFSAVDAIDPPQAGFIYSISGNTYAPSTYDWRHNCLFSSEGQSSSDIMSNGNIFINASGGQGGAGVMYEVNQNGTIIWGPYNADTQKAFRYECEHPAIISLEPFMNSTATSSCFSTSVSNFDNQNLSIYPNPTNGFVNIDFSFYDIDNVKLKIRNQLGQEIKMINRITSSSIDLANQPNGIYHFSIFVDDEEIETFKVALIK